MAFCSQCGNQLNTDDKFCSKCGTPVQLATDAPVEPKTVGDLEKIAIEKGVLIHSESPAISEQTSKATEPAENSYKALIITVLVLGIIVALGMSASNDQTTKGVGFTILVVVGYFFPLIVSAIRKHNNESAIGMLNLLLGWTVLGWIGALVWACSDNVKVRI